MAANILLIVTDQLTWRALPCYGNMYVKTPGIDRIAENGVRFTNCYTPCPLCQPARAAFWSGRYPHETKVLSNGRKWPVDPVPEDFCTLGETFAKAGYKTVHFGKCHDAGALRGFECSPEQQIHVEDINPAFPYNFDTYEDRDTTEKTVEFLNTYSGERPFLMVCDLVNPHNICGWVGENQGEHQDIPTGKELPPLPENFEFEDLENRPAAVRYICCSHNRQAQAALWTERNYQHYLAAYYHYLETADKEIGRVLDALESSSYADNTMIVFFADHGDSMAARGRVTKQVDFYEEVTRVPLLFGGKGITGSREIHETVSLLDLYPTLCGYAGIPVPKGLRGVDLSVGLRGGQVPKRDYVASQWHTEWGYTVSPGRMVCNGRFKYTYYIEDQGEELYDLKNDPYEKRNVAGEPPYGKALADMRRLFRQYLQDTGDDFLELKWHADTKWRSHKPGYHNHRGIAAPQEQ